MIAFLCGQVAARGGSWVDVDVGGIGFHLLVSGHAAAAMPAPGAPVRLLTSLVLREDGATLFGFCDEAERDAFGALTGVTGVGPKLALAVLSALTPAALSRTLEAEDVAALCRVSGVGRKTAQRLILELRGQLAPAVDAALADSGGDGPQAEARAALVALGYAPADAASAVLSASSPGADAASLVRAALRGLGAGR